MITNAVFDHWMLMALMAIVFLVSLVNGIGSVKERDWSGAVVELAVAAGAVWVFFL